MRIFVAGWLGVLFACWMDANHSVAINQKQRDDLGLMIKNMSSEASLAVGLLGKLWREWWGAWEGDLTEEGRGTKLGSARVTTTSRLPS